MAGRTGIIEVPFWKAMYIRTVKKYPIRCTSHGLSIWFDTNQSIYFSATTCEKFTWAYERPKKTAHDYSRYSMGCRCDICRAARAAYVRAHYGKNYKSENVK